MNHSTSPLPEQAVKTQGHTSATLAYYAAYVALGLSLAALGPTLSDLAKQTGSSLSQISYLFTALSLGYMQGALWGGRLFDRVPGHPVMAATLFISAILLAILPLAPALWILLAIMPVLGFLQATLDVGANTLLTCLHRENLGPYMNALHFFFGVGAFLSPIIIARVMLAGGGLLWAYWILALCALPVALWLVFLPSPQIWKPADNKRAPVDIVLIILIAVGFFLCVGAEVGFAGWIFTYAVQLELANNTMAAYLTSAFWGSFTLFRLIGIPIARYFRMFTILLADLIGCILSIGLILAWPTSTTVIWIGTLGFGLSMASIFATLLSLAGEYMDLTGRVTGWFFVGSSAGAMVIPWVIGQFFETLGPQITMFVLLADLILALAVVTALTLYLKRSAVYK